MSSAHNRELQMFKTVLTLFRGSVAAAGEELEDRSALLILDQQMRDAAAAVERSKRTLALAIAGDQQEGRRLETTCVRIADLEVRATAAIEGGRDDLAREAAQAIANLEAERDAALTARLSRRPRRVLPADRSLDEGLPHHGHRDADPDLHYADQDGARQLREQQVRQPHRGRQG